MTAVHTHDDVTVRHDHDHDHDDLDPHDHPGGHGHDDLDPHDHPGGHGHEAGVPPAGGPVVVDIGGDVGALVVHVDASRVGQELHVRRPGEAATTHTGIWERRLGSRAVVVAVFPALVEGGYAVLDRAGEAVLDVEIIGGEVREITLPA